MGRCEYCLSTEAYCGCSFEVDHIIPTSAGGTRSAENFALACAHCNAHKGARVEVKDPQTGLLVKLFHPRVDRWRDHFAWTEGGTRVAGLTERGRATVAALQMNDAVLVFTRALWGQWGVHPPAVSGAST